MDQPEATFVITEPEVISADNELCNGALKQLSRGSAPYLLNLFDAYGNLLRSDATESIFTYEGLIPGLVIVLKLPMKFAPFLNSSRSIYLSIFSSMLPMLI